MSRWSWFKEPIPRKLRWSALIVLAAVALAGLAMYRLRLEPALFRYKPLELLAMEDTASLLAYGTGSPGTLVLAVLFGLGLVGERALALFRTPGGTSPFAWSPLPLSTVHFAVVGVLAATLIGVLAEVVTESMSRNEFVPSPRAF